MNNFKISSICNETVILILSFFSILNIQCQFIAVQMVHQWILYHQCQTIDFMISNKNVCKLNTGLRSFLIVLCNKMYEVRLYRKVATNETWYLANYYAVNKNLADRQTPCNVTQVHPAVPPLQICGKLFLIPQILAKLQISGIFWQISGIFLANFSIFHDFPFFV